MGMKARVRREGDLSPADIRRIMGTLDKDNDKTLRTRAIVGVVYDTGLKVSEVCAIRPRHIRWDDGTIRVLAQGSRKARDVAVREKTLGLMEEWNRRRPESGPFFNERGGGPLILSYLRRTVKDAAIEALGKRRGSRVNPAKICKARTLHRLTDALGSSNRAAAIREALKSLDPKARAEVESAIIPE